MKIKIGPYSEILFINYYFVVYSCWLSSDGICFTIYVPKVGWLTYYCPYVARKAYSVRVFGINLKRNGSGNYSNERL
jgi:hypothetical protein